jgi:CRP/FNR family transcriptional regulator, dissimilatory nitrate respiration regulator
MIAIMSETFSQQLVALASKRNEIESGTYLFHEGDRVKMVFVVESGLIELSRRQPDGESIVLQRATDMAVLAESSLYSQDYHCDAIASVQSTVFQISKSAFLAHLHEDRQFSQLWSASLAREVRSVRTRCEILSRKTVAQRLDGWMAWHDNKLPEKGQWKDVARQIAVTPEALYRELARRRNCS